jgi:H-NS histone C-terminal domain
MSHWEYRKIALNEPARSGDEIDVLCEVGLDGWELVAVLPNNMAYLKRQVAAADTSERPAEAPQRVVHRVHAGDSPSPGEPEARLEAKAKYRNPETNDTWSGRGRMPNWLKRKQEAGEDIEEYLV